MLTARRRASPSFVDGFERVCEAGGVALYRRVEASAPGGDGPSSHPGFPGAASALQPLEP
jgi:hypothetical protein